MRLGVKPNIASPEGTALCEPRVKRSEWIERSATLGSRCASIPNVTLVDLKSVPLANLAELVFECHFHVVMLLIGDVSLDLFDIRLAY